MAKKNVNAVEFGGVRVQITGGSVQIGGIPGGPDPKHVRFLSGSPDLIRGGSIVGKKYNPCDPVDGMPGLLYVNFLGQRRGEKLHLLLEANDYFDPSSGNDEFTFPRALEIAEAQNHPTSKTELQQQIVLPTREMHDMIFAAIKLGTKSAATLKAGIAMHNSYWANLPFGDMAWYFAHQDGYSHLTNQDQKKFVRLGVIVREPV